MMSTDDLTECFRHHILTTIGWKAFGARPGPEMQMYEEGFKAGYRRCKEDNEPELGEVEGLEAERAEQWRLRREAEASRDVEKAVSDSLKLENEILAHALCPFVNDWADENGWTDSACQKDRVVDWFGPSDFRAARTAYMDVYAARKWPPELIAESNEEPDALGALDALRWIEDYALSYADLGDVAKKASEAIRQVELLQEAIQWCLGGAERNGSLPEAYEQKLRSVITKVEAA